MLGLVDDANQLNLNNTNYWIYEQEYVKYDTAFNFVKFLFYNDKWQILKFDIAF